MADDDNSDQPVRKSRNTIRFMERVDSDEDVVVNPDRLDDDKTPLSQNKGKTTDSVDRFDWCGLCYEDFQDPRILPCMHTFCFKCLGEFVDQISDENQFPCPLCKNDTKIPNGGVTSFKSNIYVKAMQASQQMEEKKSTCETCEEALDAETYCLECKQNFCSKCGNIHLKMKLSKEHHLVNSLTMAEIDGRRMKSYTFCDDHRQEITLYCTDCSVPLCNNCQTGDHEDHNLQDIVEYAKETKQDLQNSIELLNNYLPSLRTRLSDVHYYENEFSSSKQYLAGVVKARAVALHKEIDDLSQVFLDEIDKEVQVEEDRVKIFKSRVSEAVKFATQQITAANHYISFGSNPDVAAGRDTLRRHLHAAFKLLPVGFIPKVDVVFTPLSGNETVSKQMFGQISKKGKLQMNLKQESSYKVPGQHLIRGIAPISGGKAWVACGFDQRLHLINRLGSRIRTIRLGKEIDIDYVTSDNNDNVYISCRKNRCVKVLNHDVRIRDLAVLNDYPRGIALSLNNDLLICVTKSSTYDNYKHSDKNVVMKYTHNGKAIVEFERSKQHMKYPRRIAENTNGDIYVSDHKESCVHVLNSDGRQKRKYNGTEGNLIGEPCGLTCDRYGHVLVTDYKKHCVHLLDQQSQHLCNILSEKDGIKNPFSVAVDGDGFLWLGCSLGMVHIFQYLL